MTVHGCGPTELPFSVDLPSGRVLEFRTIETRDISPMMEWYAGLDTDSVYRRFFTGSPPGPHYFERLASIADRGGCCIVVFDTDPSSPGSDAVLVAEASYEILQNGNGEMAITVAVGRRGWLGPYLLALLCSVAASNDVPNLEAEILTINRPMRALSRSRGEAFLPGSDWQTVRVVFSTNGSVPTWSSSEQPRVLVEMRGIPWDALADMAASGQQVIACGGPEGRPRRCPLLDGEECPLASGADAIVVGLPLDETTERLLAVHQQLHPDVPVELVQRNAGGRVTWELGTAVERALGERDVRH